MAKTEQHLSAARQFYADCPRPASAREVCESGDEAAGVMIDEWTEKLMRNGDVPRVFAQRCAAAVVEAMREKDERCVEGGAGDNSERAKTLEMLSRIGREIALAPRPRMTASALLLAMGDFVVARSARQLAERVKLSHELVADRVREWQALLGLPPTSGQKSPQAIRSYQGTNGAKAKFKHEN